MKRRRTLAYYNEHPRAFDQAIEDWNERQLAREEARIDREPDTDPDFEAWLEQLEPDEDTL